MIPVNFNSYDKTGHINVQCLVNMLCNYGRQSDRHFSVSQRSHDNFPPYKINALSCLFTSQSEVMFYTQRRLLITVSWCSHPWLCCWTPLLSSGPGIVLAVWRKMILFTILLCSRYVLGPSRVTLPLSLLGTASPPPPLSTYTNYLPFLSDFFHSLFVYFHNSWNM